MDEYESLSHTKWECKYHVVFIPKYRMKMLYVESISTLGRCSASWPSGRRVGSSADRDRLSAKQLGGHDGCDGAISSPDSGDIAPSRAIDQVRIRHQPTDGEGARHRRAAGTPRHRRRGDRIVDWIGRFMPQPIEVDGIPMAAGDRRDARHHHLEHIVPNAARIAVIRHRRAHTPSLRSACRSSNVARLAPQSSQTFSSFMPASSGPSFRRGFCSLFFRSVLRRRHHNI
jgi:hypothetical protein